MKKLLSNILRKLNVNGRDLPILLLSLLLAFSIWTLHNLSLKYTEYLRMPITAQCNIEGHAAESSNKNEVVARCRTTGFNILRNILLSKTTSVPVPFSRMYQDGGEVFYVTEKELIENVALIFGPEVSFEHYLTDTLYFRFPYETYRRVPIRPLHELDFKTQYTSVGEMKIEPDSVTVYGEPNRLEKLDYVYTEPIKLSHIDGSVHGVAKLEQIKGIRYAADDVRYSVDVARYVELPATVSISAVNVPPAKSMLMFPAVVDVLFRCRFPYTADVEESVSFYIDYNEFVNSRSGTCMIHVGVLPDEVISVSIEPQVAECVLTDR